MQSGTLVNAKI